MLLVDVMPMERLNKPVDEGYLDGCFDYCLISPLKVILV